MESKRLNAIIGILIEVVLFGLLLYLLATEDYIRSGFLLGILILNSLMDIRHQTRNMSFSVSISQRPFVEDSFDEEE